MANTALITGASAGIGTEFARYHARHGGDLVIAARRAEALEELKKEIEAAHDDVTVHVVPADLGTQAGADKLIADVDALGVDIDILINNAGFGGHGTILERDAASDRAMIDLNVQTLVALTHHFGAKMAERGKGRILNVGSTAGFMPGPGQATYFATKAFVNSFSQAVDQELRAKGVTCTVLAPGYVETEFAKVANLEDTNLVKGGGKSAKSVAKFGYDAMRRGELVVVNEKMLSFLLNWVTPLLPRRTVLKMVDKMQAK
ncbi:MAG: SDR family oxidoreductase [Pseudomonadota bacterium]